MIYQFIAFIAFLLNFSTAMVVLARNPKNNLNQLFWYLTFMFALWNIFIVLRDTGLLYNIATEFHFVSASVTLLVGVWVHFARRFVGKEEASTWYYLPAILILPFLVFSDMFFTGYEKTYYGYKTIAGTLAPIYYIYIEIFIIWGFYEVMNAYRKSTGMDKERIKWVVLGIGSVCFVGFFDVVIILAGLSSIVPTFSNLMTMVVAYYFVYKPYAVYGFGGEKKWQT